jgi:hypothetical protein
VREAHRRLPAPLRHALLLVCTVIGLAAGYAALAFIGSAAISMLTRGLVLLPRAGVQLVIAVQQGVDGWALAGRVFGSVANALTSPPVLFSLVALELIGAGALYVMQLLLRHEGRSARSQEEEP